jgi:hypothetical protein
MPRFWIDIPPVRVLTHKGVSVYNAYDCDDYRQPARYHFVTQTHETDSDSIHAFDVREFKKLPSVKLLADQKPDIFRKPRHLTPEETFMTQGYADAIVLGTEWSDIKEPALIIAALIEGIEAGLIINDY